MQISFKAKSQQKPATPAQVSKPIPAKSAQPLDLTKLPQVCGGVGHPRGLW